MDFLYTLISPFLGYIVSSIGVIAAVAAIWFRGKNAGIQSERNKALKEAYDAERTRNSIEDRVRNASDDAFERMRNHWLRPEK